MNFCKIIILLFTVCVSNFKGQYSLSYSDDFILEDIYSLSSSTGKIKIPFPGYNVVSDKSEGYDIQKIKDIIVNGNIVSIPVGLNNIKIMYPTSTYILQYKTNNIKKLEINIIRISDTIRIKSVNNLGDGYQLPIEESFASSDNIQKIEYIIHRNDMGKSFEFYVGQTTISYYKEFKDISPFSPDYNKNKALPSPSSFSLYNIYNHYPKSYHQNMMLSNINIDYSTNYSDSLIKLVNENIKKYPYYEERKINAKKIEKVYQNLIDSFKKQKLDECSLTGEINDFLATNFNDPHFKLITRCKLKEKHLGPLRVQLINNKYLISANLDSTLLNKIPLNSELISIGKLDLKDYKKNGSNYLKDLKVDRINSLLMNKEGENVNILIKVGNKVNKVSYKIKGSYSIPENFKPKQGMFKVIDSISYFKINLFSREIPTMFVNNLSEINNSKSLIIDLRGNGGGEGNEAARLLSYIIERDFKYADIKDRTDNSIDHLEVHTNKNNFSFNVDKKIVLLVDHLTACAAELFTDALRKNRKNVMVIGKENTAGSITPTYNVLFNDLNKTTLVTGSYAPYKYSTHRSIQRRGIRPDVRVKMKKVTDLQPYNDKVLLQALKLIK